MAKQDFYCSVITPEGKVFDGPVRQVVVPAHDGQIGILLNRAPLVCRLGAGRLRLSTVDGELSWFIDGGFARVLDNDVVVLTQTALRPEKIDRAEAQKMLEEARHLPATDEASLRRKSRLEAAARTRLRMALRV